MTPSDTVRLHIECINANVMGPERTVEMQRLEAGPLESLVQVRVPVGPELNNGEEGLQDGLVLVVAARRA